MQIIIYRKKLFILVLLIALLFYLWQSFAYLNLVVFISQAVLLGFLFFLAIRNFKEFSYPDKFIIPAVVAGVAFNILLAFNEFKLNNDINSFVKIIGFSLLGIFIGGGYFISLRFLNRVVYKNEFKEYPVWGDIKLIAAIGSFVGPLVIWVAILHSVIIFIFAVIYRVMTNHRRKIDNQNVPTGAGYFIALVIFYSNHIGVLNFLNVLLCAASIYLLADAFVHEEKVCL
jgi:hypothetical protein